MKSIQSNLTSQTTGTLLLLIVVSIAILNACQDTKGANISSIDGDQKMRLTLADVARKINNSFNPFAAQAKVAHLDSIIMLAKNPSEQGNALLQKGIALLEFGDEAASVALFEQVLAAAGSNPSVRVFTEYWLGTAYLRLAERNNCVSGHTGEACVLPLQGGGIHQDKTAARKAIKMFEAYLIDAPKEPNAIDAQWLLNLSYMAVGEYPKNVPKKWLIPNLDAPDYPVKPFIDIAADLKIMVNNRAGGSIVDDFDNDGFLDIVTSAWDVGVDVMSYFHNNGDGTFSDRSEASGLKAFTGGLNIQQTDYNNDGKLDIWVLRGAWQGQNGRYGEQPNSLLRNNGDGTFSDVTIDAGILSYCPTQTSTWNDFNHDGWLDVFIGNETVPGNNVYPCELYINNQNGTFTNMAIACGADKKQFVKGVGSGDYDNDGWADLFLSTMDGQKMLLRNTGLSGNKVVFEDATQKAGLSAEIFRSFPTFFFDYDNDGWLDIFVCNYEFGGTLSNYAAKEQLHPSNNRAGKPHFYHNNQDGTFTNVTSMGANKTAFAMGANFGDFDNDGYLDIYLGTGNPNFQSLIPNKLFMNIGGKKFADASSSSRTGNLQKGHGVSIVDMDNDGDQDIHVEMGGAYRGDNYPSSFYMNPGQNDNRWIYLKLEGTKSNRVGIGSKITLKFHENGVERMVYRELNSGGSFGSSPLRREIGIGQATLIDEISITWPASGITQVLKNVKPNQYIGIKEGQDGFETLELKPITFRKADGSIPMCAPAR